MRKILIASILILTIKSSFGQDTLLTYSRVLNLDSTSKFEIFDKALVWCSKNFRDSKSAINVKERDGGIIGGKAYYLNPYKIPKRKDSILGIAFCQYYFDWLIEIKDGKARFTVTNVLLGSFENQYKVTTNSKAPFEIWLQPKSKTELEWKLSKEAFIISLDNLTLSLKTDLTKTKIDW